MVDEMKVTQAEQNKFEPITIVLETEEEAAIMWAALRSNVQQAMIVGKWGIDISGSVFCDVETDMFEAFDFTYDALEGKYGK